jgi:hypothetical protein
VSETVEMAAGTGASSKIEWLELSFDLVAVAAVAVLTDGLREDVSWSGSVLFALLYTGIWFGWVSVVLYANVAGSATRNRFVCSRRLTTLRQLTITQPHDRRATCERSCPSKWPARGQVGLPGAKPLQTLLRPFAFKLTNRLICHLLPRRSG